MMRWALILALAPGRAVAQEPPADAAYEVTVHGEAAIRDARARVIRSFEAEGWRAKDRGDQVVFKGPRLWMGEGHLDKDTGTFTFTQPRVTVAGLKGHSVGYAPALLPNGALPVNEAASLATEREIGPPIPTFSLQLGFPSHRKVVAQQERLFTGVSGSITAYNDVIRETRFRERLEELPDRLDALWRDGAALDGGEPLGTPAERRAALFAFWATRSDNPEGDAFTHAVEVWIAATLKSPVTDPEAAAAEALRADGRKLPR